MSPLHLDRPASPDEVAAITLAIALALAAEEAAAAAPAPTPLEPWRAAARVESLGLVRRIPGQLDMRYMGAATRERLSRPLRQHPPGR